MDLLMGVQVVLVEAYRCFAEIDRCPTKRCFVIYHGSVLWSRILYRRREHFHFDG